MAEFLPILLLALVVAASGFYGKFVLAPFLRVSRGIGPCVRLHLPDWFALCFIVMAPIAVLRLFSDQSDQSPVNFVGVALMCVYGLVWWKASTQLSGINVVHSGRRFAFLAAVVPIAFFGSFPGVPAWVACLFTLANEGLHSRQSFLPMGASVGGFNLLIVAILAGVPLSAVVGRRLCVWAVSAPGGDETLDTPQQESQYGDAESWASPGR